MAGEELEERHPRPCLLRAISQVALANSKGKGNLFGNQSSCGRAGGQDKQKCAQANVLELWSLIPPPALTCISPCKQ